MAQSKYRRECKTSTYQRENKKRKRATTNRIKEIERYFRTAEIQLRNQPATWEQFLEEYKQGRRSLGPAISWHSWARHSYTNYEQICQYAEARWGRCLPGTTTEILHPRIRKLVGPWLWQLSGGSETISEVREF